MIATIRLPPLIGGTLESEKAAALTSKFGLEIRPEQIILCHTPFQQLAEIYGDREVLILGHERCLHVASTYGAWIFLFEINTI